MLLQRMGMAVLVSSLALVAGCKKDDTASAPPQPAAPPAAATAPAAPPTENDLLSEGAALFSQKCASCHGVAGTGGTAPALLGQAYRYGNTKEAVTESITKGRPNGMPAFSDLTPRQLDALASYVLNLKK